MTRNGRTGGSDPFGMLVGIAGLGIIALVALSLVVKFFWQLTVVGVVVGLVFGGRALARRVRERREIARSNADEIAYRAERQDRMARRGDRRGVYGDDGATLMDSVAPEPSLPGSDTPDPKGPVATVATTADGLAALFADKPREWRWAAFASVLVQRRAAVQARLRDCLLGFAVPGGTRISGGVQAAGFIGERMEDMLQIGTQVNDFMLTPAFKEVFGSPDDGDSADPDGIVQVGNRLMDYHDRFLALAEQCRDVQAPLDMAGLMRDVREMMNSPLESYRTFIDDLLEIIDEMPDMLRYSTGTVHADPVILYIHVDNQLVERISKQVMKLAKG